MEWELSSDRPIYLQLMEGILYRIASGEYPKGSQLPPVRVLALSAEVNPNTMQKALTELEHLGLVYTKRTSGRFITEEEEKITNLREQLASDQIRDFVSFMRRAGFSSEEIIALIQKHLKEES